jgi:ribosome-associated protein
MDSKKLALLCRELADNKKAENIVILEVRDLSSVTDYFVIASGNSEPHLRAITEEITSELREKHDLRPRAIDGALQTAWIVLDYFDVIVHVMKQDVREKYDLETLCEGPECRKLCARTRPLRSFRGSFSRGLNHLIQQFLEVFQTRCRNDNRIPASTDIFRNPQKTSAGIFLQSEHKGLALNLNSIGFESVFIDGRLG